MPFQSTRKVALQYIKYTEIDPAVVSIKQIAGKTNFHLISSSFCCKPVHSKQMPNHLEALSQRSDE